MTIATILACISSISLLIAHATQTRFLDVARMRLGTTTKVGDSTGRLLYAMNTVELPTNISGKKCITARHDDATHAMVVDTSDHDDNSLCWACYEDSINSTGWDHLMVETSPDEDVPLQTRAYCAGLVEGLLTSKQIFTFYQNVNDLLVKDIGAGYLPMIERVMRTALVAWETYSGGDAGLEPTDDLARQAWAAMIQLRGIRDGNNILAYTNETQEISMYQLMLVNMHAELPAIVQLYAFSEQAKLLYASDQQAASGGSFLQMHSQTHRAKSDGRTWTRWSAHKAHGTAIVKRTGPRTQPLDLLAGHVTYGEYSEMNRMLKHYNLHFGTLISGLHMSSYPGCISSTDDFIMTNHGFVLMSTSLFLPTTGEYSEPPTTNDGFPSFLRSAIASRLATQPRMWAKVYAYLAGIAAGKQWLILDYSKFKQGQMLANDTLWMVESLPRLQRAGDVTHSLYASGFFEAHGVPHFRQIREVFGYPATGPGSYQEHRASSLVDKGSTISSLHNLREVLQETSSSRGPTQIPINTRNDLLPEDPIPSGGTDIKVTGLCLARKNKFQAKSGPPPATDKTNFSWSSSGGAPKFNGWPRRGQPNLWNFDFHTTSEHSLSGPVGGSDGDCEQAPSII